MRSINYVKSKSYGYHIIIMLGVSEDLTVPVLVGDNTTIKCTYSASISGVGYWLLGSSIVAGNITAAILYHHNVLVIPLK